MSLVGNNVLNRYYDLEYYSSSQCTLYIGDVWVDDVAYVEYTRQQNKTPLYGYASQHFDDTAAGHVIVQGAFAVNFKEQGYLWAILRRYFDQGPGTFPNDPVSQKKLKQLTASKLGASNAGIGGRPILGANGTRVSRASIERLTQGKASRQERYDAYRSLAGYATFSPGTGKDKVFEDIVEAFEDELWKYSDNRKLLEQIRRIDDNVFDGFDMYILFGNYSNPKANHTATKIIGVRLISEGKTINSDNGEPILEVYQFIARTTL